MTTKTLGFRKSKTEVVNYKRLNVKGFEDDFLDFWKSLGFRKELNKDSKSYANSIKSLRKVLSGEFSWAENITIEKLKSYCVVFKNYSEENIAHDTTEGGNYAEIKKLYFHQFVMTYSGFSYLRGVIQGKMKAEDVSEEVKEFSNDIIGVLSCILKRKNFSSGEHKRINNFSKEIINFYQENFNKIAFGIDKLTIVKASYRVVSDFAKMKGITPNILIYTGNYASGAALAQAMETNSYWKIYEKFEEANACVMKDPDKTAKVMAEREKKEEDELPDIVKRRREEKKKNGIITKKAHEDESCTRKEEYLRKKKERRNPFAR